MLVVFVFVFVLVEARTASPMSELRLLRAPTWAGGLIAAFTMNGSLFALFATYTIYLENGLGYDAPQTGVGLLIITGATLVVSAVAGRLSRRIPVHWLIGPGLLLVGIGILLTAGVTGASGWTLLIVGFLVAGFGTGLVNPPLASTAVGVVPPRSSGINTTFRMFGQALVIAVSGSVRAASPGVHGSTRAGYAAALNGVGSSRTSSRSWEPCAPPPSSALATSSPRIRTLPPRPMCEDELRDLRLRWPNSDQAAPSGPAEPR